jgi:predicted dehydrogenase
VVGAAGGGVSAERIRIGVIGLGAIAQIHHLENLLRLSDRYELTHLCDLSPGLVDSFARRLGVRRASTDWRELCADPAVDAVVILTSGSHGPIVLEALERRKHVFTEKPLCYTLREADEIIAAANGLSVRVGYMKLHDAVFASASRLAVRDPRLVRVDVKVCLEPEMRAHANVVSFDDIPAEERERASFAREEVLREALGDGHASLQWVYREVCLESLIHYLPVLRGLFGSLPEEMLYACAWPFEDAPGGDGSAAERDGLSLLSVSRLSDRCIVELLWEWLPDLPEYTESISIDGPAERVLLEFPQPFLRDGRGVARLQTGDSQVRREERWQGGHESAFLTEMNSFHEAIRDGAGSEAELSGARADILFLQRVVARLALENGLSVGGEVGLQVGGPAAAAGPRS